MPLHLRTPIFYLRCTLMEIILIAFLFLSSTGFAQQQISWSEAKSKLLSQNVLVKAEENYNQTVQKAFGMGVDIPKTEFSIQRGQYNSGDADQSYTIAQSFHFPTYYFSNNNYYSSQKELITIQTELKKLELLSELYYQYYSIVQLKEKEKFLNSINVQLQNTKESVRLQFEKGLLNTMEKSMPIVRFQLVSEVNTPFQP